MHSQGPEPLAGSSLATGRPPPGKSQGSVSAEPPCEEASLGHTEEGFPLPFHCVCGKKALHILMRKI